MAYRMPMPLAQAMASRRTTTSALGLNRFSSASNVELFFEPPTTMSPEVSGCLRSHETLRASWCAYCNEPRTTLSALDAVAPNSEATRLFAPLGASEYPPLAMWCGQAFDPEDLTLPARLAEHAPAYAHEPLVRASLHSGAAILLNLQISRTCTCLRLRPRAVRPLGHSFTAE